MIKAGIIGATGYTGMELIRLLSLHPDTSISVVTSESEKGKRFIDVFPTLHDVEQLKFSAHDSEALLNCDVVFFATPHGTAMHYVPRLLEAGCRIVDLSADFRIKDATLWQQWYGVEHACAEFLEQAIYGLPEINRENIKVANLVANPGCYPTAISLGLIPALKNSLIDTQTIIADAKSGVSGAGRKAALAGLHAEVSESFKAYSVSGHRHLPEITQTLSLSAGGDVSLTFVPHLVPMNRGILATLYVHSLLCEIDLHDVYQQYYQDEPFVSLMPKGQFPETRFVRGTNLCQIAIQDKMQSSNTIVIISAIDNLVKGAAGQAIQNMNLMFGLAENKGLITPPLLP